MHKRDKAIQITTTAVTSNTLMVFCENKTNQKKAIKTISPLYTRIFTFINAVGQKPKISLSI